MIPTDRSYEYFANQECPYERVWFYGTGEMFDSLYKMFFGDKLLLISHSYVSGILVKLLKLLENFDNTPSSFETLYSIIFSLYTTANAHTTMISHEFSSGIGSTASMVKNYLYSHYADKFDLTMLAEKFSLSKNQIIRVFKNQYKVTPQVFHMMHKIDVAEDMIRANKTSRVIADALDFSNEKHFSKMFYKYKSYLPSMVRRIK